jgi:hypothetical protein
MGVTNVSGFTNIQSAIATASKRTGIDFNYLLGQAQVESGMRSDARAGTSSATGLYQFVEQSWLGIVKEHGAEHGMAWAADAIRQNSAGRYSVADSTMRQAILNLRKDPQAASLMAAEHASDNKAALESSLGRAATGTDLYMAHFLGLGGARSFLSEMQSNPNRSGAALFPAAAHANRGVFFASNGAPRSLAEIYQNFAGKLDRGAAAHGATGLASNAMNGADGNALAQALAGSDVEVVMGNQAVNGDGAWLQTTLANLNTMREPMNPLRPTPDNARLAYMMLASMGA